MNALRIIMPVIFIFILLAGIIFTFTRQFEAANVSPAVLNVGNALLLLVTIGTIFFQHNALKHNNPNVFVRSVMTAMLLKMAIGIVAVIIYVKMNPDTYNRYGIFGTLLMYLIYLTVEVTVVSKLNKAKNAHK
jgi:hypothetical protein